MLKGYGQNAIKGTCVHFAQCVEEVNEQLPLRIQDSQIIIVSELLKGDKKTRDHNIRPKYVRQALEWLIAKSVLYRDVVLVERTDYEYDLNHVFVSSIKKGGAPSNSCPPRSITSSK